MNKTDEADLLYEQTYQSQLNDKQHKNKKLPLFVWILLLLIILLFISVFLQNAIILQIIGGIFALIILSLIIYFMIIELKESLREYNLNKNPLNIFWVLLIIFFPFFGAMIYRFRNKIMEYRG